MLAMLTKWHKSISDPVSCQNCYWGIPCSHIIIIIYYHYYTDLRVYRVRCFVYVPEYSRNAPAPLYADGMSDGLFTGSYLGIFFFLWLLCIFLPCFWLQYRVVFSIDWSLINCFVNKHCVKIDDKSSINFWIFLRFKI